MNRLGIGMVLLFALAFQGVYAQHLLEKKISLTVKSQTVRSALSLLEGQGGFYFSYEPRLLNLDSLVTFSVRGQSTRSVLHMLFQERYQYKETEDHIIIQKALLSERYLLGRVEDDSGPVEFASVYTKNLETVALTDASGQFRLKVKSFPVEVTASKMGYRDTTSLAHSSLVLFLEPREVELQEVRIRASPIERSILSRWFVSKKLRIHARNITQFFVNTPYQLSFFPGIGTQGKRTTKSINKVSLNMTGGYSAGTEGVELAGLFNLTQGHVKYAQAAGLFNVVERDLLGAQLGGVYNQVHGNLAGVQAAGLGNYAKTGEYGVQVAGLFNAAQTFVGTQAAGFYNYSTSLEGVQVSGALNRVNGRMHGVQIAGLMNYADEVEGVQVGLINRAKHSKGYSIGLLNLIGNGDANLSVFVSESSPWNLALKTGTSKLYSILSLSTSWSDQALVPGFGLGKEFALSPALGAAVEYTAYVHPYSFFRIQGMLLYPKQGAVRIFGGPVLQHRGRTDGLSLGGQAGVAWYFQRKLFRVRGV